MAKMNIDITKVVKKAMEGALDGTEYKGMTIRQWIKEIASGEYQRVKHGWWICEDLQNGFGKITCSCCGESINVSPRYYDNLKEYEKFCSSCGAKMDGGYEE
jgi:hypothetical protein